MTNPISLITTQELMRHAMIARLAAAIAGAFREPEEHPHFHLGPGAQPFVCEARHCESPGLALTRASAST